jgi:hypothetical protein
LQIAKFEMKGEMPERENLSYAKPRGQFEISFGVQRSMFDVQRSPRPWGPLDIIPRITKTVRSYG